jgi:predicted TIM-barrel fold metal-dependent hydrolase
MKIDIFAHLMTQKVVDTFVKRVGNMEIVGMRPDEGVDKNWFDMNIRFEIMNKVPDMVQVLVPTGQPLETHASAKDAIYIAQVYNDELAAAVSKYPDKFITAVALIPLNNVSDALKEMERTIKQLKFKGILLHTPVHGRPLDLPDFIPIYEHMLDYDLPIWIHPTRHVSIPDYANEKESKYGLYHVFGWPYETTIAMGRLVCSGILMKYPKLKFITHHAGAMAPFFADRIPMLNCSFGGKRVDGGTLLKQFRMFYNDTALNGNAAGIECAHAFFGTDHILFGTDMPYGPAKGEVFVRKTIDNINGMNISEADKKKIFEENARTLLHLEP